MRDHVLSLVSHDLRSPLNAIHSWAYVLDRKIDANDATAQRALEGIRNGVEQQVKLLESIVDTTRAETRALALNRAPFALRSATRPCCIPRWPPSSCRNSPSRAHPKIQSSS